MTLASDQELNESEEIESQAQTESVITVETPNPDNPKEKETDTIGKEKCSRVCKTCPCFTLLSGLR